MDKDEGCRSKGISLEQVAKSRPTAGKGRMPVGSKSTNRGVISRGSAPSRVTPSGRGR